MSGPALCPTTMFLFEYGLGPTMSNRDDAQGYRLLVRHRFPDGCQHIDHGAVDSEDGVGHKDGTRSALAPDCNCHHSGCRLSVARLHRYGKYPDGGAKCGRIPVSTRVTLVAFLLFFERSRLAALALVPAVLWSPEIAVMSLAVYGVHETARIGFFRAALRALGITLGAFAGFTFASSPGLQSLARTARRSGVHSARSRTVSD